MKINPKALIFILVLFAVGFIFMAPYLSGDNKSTETSPGEKLNSAKAKGRPVFLEFHSGT